MDSDKIIVLETGSVVEFDHPYHLLQNTDSKFYGLLTKIEDSAFLDLKQIAEQVILKNTYLYCKEYMHIFSRISRKIAVADSSGVTLGRIKIMLQL